MKIAIIGYGAWGRALASVFAEAGLSVTAWSRSAVNNVASDEINITNDIVSVGDAEIILMVVPAQSMRSVCVLLEEISIKPEIPLIICSKGIECNSLALMSEVISDTLPHKNLAILSGPNFAHEIISGLPSSASLACEDQHLAEDLVTTLSTARLILRPNSDVIGTQIFGAVKNVIAIACGLFDGKQLGQNAKSSLITVGLQEIKDLCIAKGGKIETSLELCGIGDLILTCSSRKSRNVALGAQLATGMTYQQILSSTDSVMEGAFTAQAVYQLAQSLRVNIRLSTVINDLLYKNEPIESGINRMLDLI